MTEDKRQTFVLISGTWIGGWIWRDVIERLRAMGHVVSAPTLTGLGERRHNGTGDTDLSTHIEDVVAHIEMADLHDVNLVGWSYGGMVSTGVNARIPGKIRSLIYLDAFVPEDGKAMVDYLPANYRSHLDALLADNQPFAPPSAAEALGIADAELARFVLARLSPHPLRSLYEPVHALPPKPGSARAYIYCTANGATTPFTQFYERLRQDRDVRTLTIDSGHFCMLSEPQKTLEALLQLAL